MNSLTVALQLSKNYLCVHNALFTLSFPRISSCFYSQKLFRTHSYHCYQCKGKGWGDLPNSLPLEIIFHNYFYYGSLIRMFLAFYRNYASLRSLSLSRT